MQALRILTLTFVAITLIACAAPNRHIQAWLDEGHDFTQYKTYVLDAVQEEPEFKRINGIIHDELDHVMQDKGYTLAGDTSDLIVRYMTKVEHSADMRAEDIPTARGIYTRYQMAAVNEGSFLVNIIERASGDVIWKGSSLRDLNNLKTKNITHQTVSEGMHELFSSFPPNF